MPTTIDVLDADEVRRTISTLDALIALLPVALGAGGGLKVEGVGRSTATATITSGQSRSAAVDLGAGFMAARITMPAAWTAAPLTFQVSVDGVTYVELRDSARDIVGHAVDVDYDYALDPDLWRGVRYLKIRSGTSTTAVVQGADRALIVTKVPLA